MKSIWFESRSPMQADAFEQDCSYDVVVVGAGLTGLTTALLLSRGGLNVAVLEARTLGAVTTGNTTAKLSLLQGTVLSGIRRHFSEEIVQAYVEGNREGQAWMLRYLKEQKVAVQRRDAYSYATSDSGRATLEREAQVARAAGLEASFVEDVALPYPTRGALRLPEQAQFHPMEVLEALATDLRSRGARIVQGVRVRDVSVGTRATVHTDQGTNQAQHVILATGTPILDRGLYFAKLEPSRSYAAAYRIPVASAALPRGMYLSVDQPPRSLRTVPVDGEELLVVGGNGHPVGKPISEQAKVADLDQWTRQWFEGAEPTHHWSAQDYRSANMVPFVGKLPRGGGNIHVATGYNKWGMTNAVAAALSLSADILGGNIPWAQTLSHRITGATDLVEGARINAAVAGKLAKGWLGAVFNDEDDSRRRHGHPEAPEAVPGPAGHDEPENENQQPGQQSSSSTSGTGQDAPGEGEGRISRRGLLPIAVSTVGDRTCRVSGVCTHLGGILSWNDAEKSWDCPLHGSRFSFDGQLLEGPATQDLKMFDADDAPTPEVPAGPES
ncbi:FAD-dependent oxidoreductase [Paeniglutamicibacter sp. Y32M11]|uniref:FAD-dependent oxidoreductase n=1 Tax=Paeniglutamicibacter sp. Y32M11 TaxID=2853258 RepID=UPI00351D5178